MTGPASRLRHSRRHGLAGLLVALFVVGGLVFSYGLEHAPTIRWCTAHSLDAPFGADVPSDHRAKSAEPAGTAVAAAGLPTLHEPPVPVPADPVDACLCLAVLLSIMMIGMAAPPRRIRSRLPAPAGRRAAPPARGAPLPPSLSSLQVLRL
ncbi:hypothetical protein ACSNOI_38165 [Actinomadura kijaniata]|uniref:hypothetical protein n=1 Tax=Actinomadura kijaniata TaxID=46161 RepID=UPI003F1D64DB